MTTPTYTIGTELSERFSPKELGREKLRANVKMAPEDSNGSFGRLHNTRTYVEELNRILR